MATCIRVLMWADLLAEYAIWVIMTYLTDVWKLGVPHAATIKTIWSGIPLILPVGFAYVVDAFWGNYLMLVISSLAFSFGLGFLTMSTAPVLHKLSGTCSAYEPECIGPTQTILFYTSLPLMAIGIAGHRVSLEPFANEQEETEDDDVSETSEHHVHVHRRGLIRGNIKEMRKRELVIALCTVIGGILLASIKPWLIKFLVTTICTLGATITFLAGSKFYIKKEVEGSPMTHLVRVIVASAARSAEQLPSPSDLIVGDGMLPHTNGLRCLDKAAIISSVYGENKWRVCTVTDVEETKIVIRMVPLWITFIMCGVVLSTSNTYFQAQAKNLDNQLVVLPVPLPILLVVQKFGEFLCCLVYNRMRSTEEHMIAPPIGISVAMIFSTLCCITAAKIETQRLNVIVSHGLVDKPNDTIPMTIFLLIPQYLLLAGVKSFFNCSVTDLFRDHFPTSMAQYFSYFTQGISGLGYLVSVLLVHVIGKITEVGGGKSWFQYTLSKSRLDNYFWTLAALSAGNFVIYVVMVTCYLYKKLPSHENESDEEQGNNDGVFNEVVSEGVNEVFNEAVNEVVNEVVDEEAVNEEDVNEVVIEAVNEEGVNEAISEGVNEVVNEVVNDVVDGGVVNEVVIQAVIDAVNEAVNKAVNKTVNEAVITSGQVFSIDMPSKFFVVGYQESVARENVNEILSLGWLSASTISVYIRYLIDAYLVDNEGGNLESDRYSFISPHLTNEHTHIIDHLLRRQSEDTLVMIPYNISGHWVLVAINTKNECIYYLDPLRLHHSHVGRAVLVNNINIAMNAYGALKGVSSRNSQWTSVQDILESGKTTLSEAYPQKHGLATFPRSRIMEVQSEWCGYLFNRFMSKTF